MVGRREREERGVVGKREREERGVVGKREREERGVVGRRERGERGVVGRRERGERGVVGRREGPKTYSTASVCNSSFHFNNREYRPEPCKNNLSTITSGVWKLSIWRSWLVYISCFLKLYSRGRRGWSGKLCICKVSSNLILSLRDMYTFLILKGPVTVQNQASQLSIFVNISMPTSPFSIFQ